MNALAGTGPLLRIAARRDLPLVGGVAALSVGLLTALTLSFQDSYPDDAALLEYAAAMERAPVQHFFNGPGDGLDTIGGMVVFEIGGYLLVLFAVLSILSVVRHSRAVEVAGIAELARSGCMGSQALGASAALAAIGAACVWGVVCALTLGLLGLGWAGAATYGASAAAVGALFATIAGIACQLAGQPRTATLAAVATLAICYLVRGVGDMRGSGLTWASPLGWAQAGRPFGAERAWPFLIVVVAVALGQACAVSLAGRRDLGAGWWPARPGRARAGRWLGGLGGLVGSQVFPIARGWWIALAGLALGFGLVSGEFARADDQLDMSAFFGAASDPVTGLVDFSSLLLAMLGAAAGVVVIGIAGREESSGRLEAICATRAGRGRWACCFIAGAFVTSGIGIVLAAGCLSVGVAWAGINRSVWDIAAPVIAYLPAAWLVVALAAAFFGLRNRAWPIGWLVVCYTVIVGVFGTMLQMPDWAMKVSPYAHASRPPVDALLGTPFVALALAAVGVAVLGVGLLRRRDVG